MWHPLWLWPIAAMGIPIPTIFERRLSFNSPELIQGGTLTHSPGENGPDFVEILGTGAIAPVGAANTQRA